MNVVEMLMHFAWFACGFVPGYCFAKQSGVLPGLITGFIVFLVILFAAGRVGHALQRK
jgi:hypothetical protein